ncbi:hypothetical protein LCGC14_0174420 [marine sediment metagenome]|uniref:Uncharacterized protein n=1 Tax=marine sediment metagenome TaxID=412755 RepID=A0A0F9XTG0_9ZZZZ
MIPSNAVNYVWRHSKNFKCIRKTTFPQIVVLCGSTRFNNLYDEMSLKFTKKGMIVLSIGSHLHNDKDLKTDPEEKIMFEELHKRKIDLADLVFIINKNGYIGSSTSSEIDYAISKKKKIEYLEGDMI